MSWAGERSRVNEAKKRADVKISLNTRFPERASIWTARWVQFFKISIFWGEKLFSETTETRKSIFTGASINFPSRKKLNEMFNIGEPFTLLNSNYLSREAATYPTAFLDTVARMKKSWASSFAMKRSSRCSKSGRESRQSSRASSWRRFRWAQFYSAWGAVQGDWQRHLEVETRSR